MFKIIEDLRIYQKFRNKAMNQAVEAEKMRLNNPMLFEDNENTESPVRKRTSTYIPTICVDFDGVIHKYSQGYKDGSIYDEPVEGAISSMAKLQRKGFRVAIFTARREYLEIGLWIKKHDVNKELNFNELIITSTKLPAVAYIDDRAIRFVNWTEALNYF